MVDSLINKFLDGYSIEVTPNAAAKIDNFSDVLPYNTRIYIAHIEGTPIEDMVKTAKKIIFILLCCSVLQFFAFLLCWYFNGHHIKVSLIKLALLFLHSPLLLRESLSEHLTQKTNF